MTFNDRQLTSMTFVADTKPQYQCSRLWEGRLQPVADPKGGARGRPAPPVTFGPNWGRKSFFLRPPPPPLSQGLGDRPPPPSEGLDRSLSTQAIEAWKVKCMTFQVFHDLYIDLMWKRCQLINVDVRTLKRTFSTHYPSRDSLEAD